MSYIGTQTKITRRPIPVPHPKPIPVTNPDRIAVPNWPIPAPITQPAEPEKVSIGNGR